MTDDIRIRHLKTFGDREIEGLSDVLIDCVEGGASVNFMLPMTRAKADAFWRGVSESVARGERVVLAAEDESGTIVGTVQVVFESAGKPAASRRSRENAGASPRRASAAIGAALLVAAEESARAAGKTLLVLDTASDDAERLYERQGWQRSARFRIMRCGPKGGFCAATFYYKSLRG